MRPLTFGVYPGGVADADQGLLTGLPDDFERADAALIALQGPAKRFIVRCYDSFQDLGSPLWAAPCAPKDSGRYAKSPARPMDLVLTSKWDSTPHPDECSPAAPMRVHARVPIHIAEHGWSTSAGRSPDRQAEVIERVIRPYQSRVPEYRSRSLEAKQKSS